MKKTLLGALGLGWIVFVLQAFIGTHMSMFLAFNEAGECTARICEVSATWRGVLIAMFVAFVGYAVYLYRKKHQVQFSLRPIWIFVAFLIGSIVLYLIQYYDLIANYYALFDAEGVTREIARSILAVRYSVVDGQSFTLIPVLFSFLSKLFVAVLALILVIVSSCGFGVWTKKLFSSGLRVTEKFFLQIVVGFGVIMVALFLLGFFGILHPITVWVLILIGCALAGMYARSEVVQVLLTKHAYQWKGIGAYVRPLLYGALFFVAILMFLHVIRPIPIGWDDIGLYMNLPSLTYDYGALVSGQGMYNWGLIMSLGFFLFNTPFVAMLLSQLGGVLAFIGIYLFVKRVTDSKDGLVPVLVSACFFLSPFILFQFGEDMKVDLGLLFMGVGTFYLSYLWYMYDSFRTWKHSLLIGALVGILLGIKFTALIFVLPIFGLLLVRWGKVPAITGGTLLFVAVLFLVNVFQFAGIEIDGSHRLYAAILLSIVGIGFLIYAWKKDHEPNVLFIRILLVVLGSLMTFAPWVIHNTLSACTSSGCDFSNPRIVLFGASRAPILQEKIVSDKEVSDDDQKLQQTLQTEGGSQKEEIQRYLGYEKGIFTYITLPFDVTLNTNSKGSINIIGWMLLAFLPLFLLYIILEYQSSVSSYVYASIYTLVALIVAYISLAVPKVLSHQVLELLVTVVFFALPIGIAFLRRHELKERFGSHVVFYLLILCSLYWFFWSYLANGIFWYGFLGCILLITLLGLFLKDLRKTYPRYFQAGVLLLLVFWIVPMMFQALSETKVKYPSTLVSDLVPPPTNGTPEELSQKDLQVFYEKCVNSRISTQGTYEYFLLFRRCPQADILRSFDSESFTMYKAGLISDDQILEFVDRSYHKAANIINATPASERIYRIGTFLPYFIKKNDTRILTDNQLDIFTSYYLPERDKAALVEVLKNSGFGFIVFDTKTATIDNTPGQTLVKKVELFYDFTKDNSALELVAEGDRIQVWKIK